MVPGKRNAQMLGNRKLAGVDEIAVALRQLDQQVVDLPVQEANRVGGAESLRTVAQAVQAKSFVNGEGADE